MKKSTRIWLIIATVMIVAGFVFALIGKSMGGDRQVVQWVVNGDLAFGPENLLNFGGSDVRLNYNQEIYSGTVERQTVDNTQKIKKLVVEIGGARVSLVTSGDDSVYFSSENAPEYQCYVDGDTLYLKSREVLLKGKGRGITLYIPEGMCFESILVELGGGTIDADRLEAEKDVEIEVGAGLITVNSLRAGELELELGAGQAVIKDSEVEKAHMEVGMGEIDFEGSIFGELSAECSMGAMHFVIYDSEDAHNYELECAMGSMKIGGSSYDGLAMERYIDNHAEYTYELECSMGEVTMTFK